MHSLGSAGKHVNGSPFQKSTYRREIYGLMVQEGSPALWITLSPAVTHSPIFLQLAGYDVDLSDIPSHVERAKLVANDPVAAALYFNTVIDAFTEFLLGYNQQNSGCFGYPSAFYGMTEEQGTGTLHNHMLVWLHNFRSVSKLRAQLENETFRKDLTDYLERIIKQGYLGDITNIEDNLEVSEVSCKNPVNPSNFHDSNNFREALNADVNKLVKVANTHSCRASCLKYGHTKCRFEFSRDIVPKSEIEGYSIELKKTDEWINNYNLPTMTYMRSNEVKFVPTGKDGRNIAWYITNYATKSQLSTHEMVSLIAASRPVSYTHLTLPTKRIV